MTLRNETTRPPPLTTVYWTISKDGNCLAETPTIKRGGEEMLPVFSFLEEAEMFLSLGTLGTGWSLRRTTAGELISTLMGSCASIGFVALDPLPEPMFRGMTGLVGVGRERFMHRLVAYEAPEQAGALFS